MSEKICMICGEAYEKKHSEGYCERCRLDVLRGQQVRREIERSVGETVDLGKLDYATRCVYEVWNELSIESQLGVGMIIGRWMDGLGEEQNRSFGFGAMSGFILLCSLVRAGIDPLGQVNGRKCQRK